MKKWFERIGVVFQGFIMINLLWYVVYIVTETTVIPNPLFVYARLPEALMDGMLLHIGASLYRIGMGLLLSLIVGIPIGLFMGYSKAANKILYPLVYFSYPIPKTALLPVAMLLLGMRDGSKIAIIFLVIVFQVIVSVRDSVQGIESSMYHVLKATGAGWLQMMYHISLPAILPALLTSMRVSIGTAVAILFFVEGYGTKEGMGYYIIDAWSRIQYVDMYLGIVVISVVGFLLFLTVDMLSKKICRWNTIK